MNVPFGLETDYSRDWVGRYHAVRSELTTININPAVAWRPLPWLTPVPASRRNMPTEH